MPPRRAHKKSRYGCDQCKRRRVKCDEQSPCANCISRELKCTFFNAPKPKAIPDDSRPAAGPERPAQVQHLSSPGTASSTPLSRSTVLRDLELMHKFSTETWKSMCINEADKHIWQIVLPREALNHDFLLGGLLALASLHTATTLEPSAALSYVDTALQYHNRTFAPFRQALDSLTPENCDAVFAHSVVTSIVGITLPRLMPHHDGTPSMTENVTVIFELLRGVSKIRRLSGPWLKYNLFSYKYGFWGPETEALDTDTDEALTRLETLNDTAIAPSDMEQHRINKDAMYYLRRCFIRFANCTDVASALAWLAAVHRDFVQSVRRRLPFALLIVMHWGVLIGQFDGRIWWANGLGKALVSELLPCLKSGDRQWENARLWPPKKMGLTT
ncbi:hypothetical protein ASPZODRAFT_68436 [Penicilliopsis zonata CBS 506.65]|uniref:Zn(2)-C6 fungal-type domain-containing protein n=1 Tax=Penicilliopsis zonata CBS 506.65 TaxID=1073090 RepID=A0A1L9SEP1_9EURO|nr:hypothetical protein ASPZODRAFT_68436 [Penicilliopsis zonata CBS 506.65]OJJ45557.1 hypothetical protein ASPZODRAFT_68436 [Penicilliopsis zonata CBS 506.65]